MDYIDNIEKVTNYIEENLEHEITLEDLAQITFFSKFHFHRIFQDIVGESVMEYIRKRRINKAVVKLINTDAKIIDIAIEYQFNSQDTFTRAFKRYYNLTPSEFRKNGKSKIINNKVNIIKGDAIMLNLDLATRIQCTESDKDQCVELLNKIFLLSKKVRDYGLLSLEHDLDNCEDVILRKGIRLVISGTLPESIKDILETYILVGNYTGKELLKRVIMLEGILAIQRGESRFILMERLFAYFGEDYLSKLELHFGIDDESNKNKIAAYLEKVKTKPPFAASTYLLEEIFKKMNNRSIQRVLRDVDVTDLINALKGASGDIEISILNSVSNDDKLMIIEELDLNSEVDKKQIIESQQKIVNVVQKLKEDGEIQ